MESIYVNAKVIKAFLDSNEPLYISEVKTKAGVNKATAVTHILRLVNLGYIEELEKNPQLRLFRKIKPNSDFEALYEQCKGMYIIDE